MSDYEAEVSLTRDQMAHMLTNNTEQFAYVLSEAISNVDIDEMIADGQLSEDCRPETVVINLRKLAMAIEVGNLS